MTGRQGGSSSRGEMKKVNVDLLSLSYGTLVFQLIRDYENDAEVRRDCCSRWHSIAFIRSILKYY